MKFDKVNVKLVENEPTYEKGLEKIQEVEKPRRQAIAEIEHYQEKIEKFQIPGGYTNSLLHTSARILL